MHFNHVLSNFSVISFLLRLVFRDFIAISQISIFLVNVQKSMQILAYILRRNLPKFKFDCMVFRTYPRKVLHRNWTRVLWLHFDLAQQCHSSSVKFIPPPHKNVWILKRKIRTEIQLHYLVTWNKKVNVFDGFWP